MFSIASKIVSCAKYGTSVYSFPSESIMDSIDIMSESNKVRVLNFSGAPIVNVWFLTGPTFGSAHAVYCGQVWGFANTFLFSS